MANIFTNAVKFIGSTLKQVATPDTLRDYRHASKLFVGGGSYQFIPKQGFLFHVFIDVNESLSSKFINSRTGKTEIGLMAKGTDLPKFTFETSVKNSYNRPSIIQTKVRFDTLTLTFHDDSANTVRNFYYDYFRYYYRDSDNGSSTNISTYNIPYRYDSRNIANFGYTRRKESTENYVRAIRLYSLHQKRFSEYILINPIIKSFRHGAHSNSADTNTLEHTMVIDYENIIYNDGAVGPTGPNGFAQLQYYDSSKSPLMLKGGVKSIFGSGGLLDTAGSILGTLNNPNATAGDYLSAALMAARGINTARNMNLKKALVSEVTGIVNQTANQMIMDSVNEVMRPGSSRTGIQVGSIATAEGAQASKYQGLPGMSSVPILAGAAILLNSTPITNRYKSNPVQASSVTTAPSNFAPRLPLNPGASQSQSASTNLNLLNDQQSLRPPSNQGTIDVQSRLRDIEQGIAGLEKKIGYLAQQAAYAQNQIATTQASIVNLDTRITAAENLTQPIGADPVQWASDKNKLIADLKQERQVMVNLNSVANTTYTRTAAEISQNQQIIDQYKQEQTYLKG